MLDSILSAAKDYIDKEVGKNSEIPKQQNKQVSDVIFNSVSNSLKTQLGGSNSGINISQLGNLLGGKNSSFADSLKKSAVDALIKKAGLKSGIAQSVVAAILPGLISTLTQKAAGGSSLGKIAGGLMGNILKK